MACVRSAEKGMRGSWLLRGLVLFGQAFSIIVAWQQDVQPHSFVTLADHEVKRFLGSKTDVDYFKLTERDGDSLLVGARNIVYNISLQDFTENKPIVWYANDAHVGLCKMKGKSEEECQNYIRVLSKQEDFLLMCGTNAFRPLCRRYTQKEGVYASEKQLPGQGLCPYDPNHNSTAIFAGGELYIATVADFSATDPLIYRVKLRTEKLNIRQLNEPNFVSSLNFGEFVFFFFRETALEYKNCGKIVYSRVARVCTKDQGGPHKFQHVWTSFLKARLNCSVEGEFPFYFNEIQSTTGIVEGVYEGKRDQLIYGVFTTPSNSISGSAVCAFSMEDILKTFDGPFKEQESINSNWLPVQSNKVPEPRPGKCVNDSRILPDLTLNFVKSHSLMDQAVPAFWKNPIVTITTSPYRFTQIAVEPQVRTPDGKTYDVLFIGTDNGKVLKAVNAFSPFGVKRMHTVIIEEIQVFQENVAVTNMHMFGSQDSKPNEGQLVIVSNDEIQSIKLHRCDSDKITSCSECVALQDPYCAWDEKNHKCTSAGSSQWKAGVEYIQNVSLGYHEKCLHGQAVNAPLLPSQQNSRHHDLANCVSSPKAESIEKDESTVKSSHVCCHFTRDSAQLSLGVTITADWNDNNCKKVSN